MTANVFRLVLASTVATGMSLAQEPGDTRQKPRQEQSGTANRSGRDAGALSGTDARFIMEAAQGGMAEVALGKLAAEKASSPDVKQFGQRMVEDHSKANDELKSIAQQKNVDLPASMGPKHQAHHDRLSKLSGAGFDRAYMSHMVADHKKDVSEFQKQSNNAKDGDLKAFASKTLPTLREHSRMAQEIHAKVIGGSARTGQDKDPRKNDKHQ